MVLHGVCWVGGVVRGVSLLWWGLTGAEELTSISVHVMSDEVVAS